MIWLIKNKIGPASMGLAMVFAMMLAFGTPYAGADGVGIFPTSVDFPDSVRDGEYYKTIGVINGGDSERTFIFTPVGPIASWLTVVDEQDRSLELESIIAPPNSRPRVLLRIRVPDDAANGDYLAKVDILAQSRGTDSQGTSAGVNVGAEIQVRVTVTGIQIIDGTLVDSSLNLVELGSPLRVSSVVKNSGNVRVEPLLFVEVLDPQGELVFNAAFQQESIFPDETGNLKAAWDTTGQELGEYTVQTSITFGDFEVGVRNLKFTLLPFGTLTRQGKLREIELTLIPGPGELGRVIVSFQNTGEIDTLAKFTGEFYSGDRLLDVLTSEEVLVLVGQIADLLVFPRVGEAGEYTVRGNVNYEGKLTDVQELSFTVSAVTALSSDATTTASEGTASEGATSEGTASEGATSEGTTSEGTTSEGSASEGTTSSEGAASETAASPSSDDGGVGAWLWIVIIAVIAALATIIFIKRKSIPGLKPSE